MKFKTLKFAAKFLIRSRANILRCMNSRTTERLSWISADYIGTSPNNAVVQINAKVLHFASRNSDKG